jgi:hypothetical protein
MPTKTEKHLAETNGNSSRNGLKKKDLTFKSLSDKDSNLTNEEIEFAKLHRLAMKDLKVDDSKNQTV